MGTVLALMEDHNLNSLIKTLFKKLIKIEIKIDFHHLVYTILKTASVKLPPKKIKYRCYRNFSESKFHNDLTERFRAHPSNDYTDFERSFVLTLDKHAPLKNNRYSRK